VASGQLKVDLSALEGVITQLNQTISNLGNTTSDSRYQTYLPDGALGSAHFAEANDLHLAHTEMKQHLEDIVTHIQGVVDDFGIKTKKTHCGRSCNSPPAAPSAPRNSPVGCGW
jgi:hypothetical protein